MINSFVNTILAITGMAVIISLGVLNMVDTEPHGFGFGLLGSDPGGVESEVEKRGFGAKTPVFDSQCYLRGQ